MKEKPAEDETADGVEAESRPLLCSRQIVWLSALNHPARIQGRQKLTGPLIMWWWKGVEPSKD